jgi:hypothetical protein
VAVHVHVLVVSAVLFISNYHTFAHHDQILLFAESGDLCSRGFDWPWVRDPFRPPKSVFAPRPLRRKNATQYLIIRIYITCTSHTHTLFIYITMPRPYLYLVYHCTQAPGHNFGPDALARKQCRARVLATLGRALGVGPYGPVLPCPIDHAKSERTRSDLLALAAVGALQLRRSRRDSGTSRCDWTACKRNYRYHLLLLS